MFIKLCFADIFTECPRPTSSPTRALDLPHIPCLKLPNNEISTEQAIPRSPLLQ